VKLPKSCSKGLAWATAGSSSARQGPMVARGALRHLSSLLSGLKTSPKSARDRLGPPIMVEEGVGGGGGGGADFESQVPLLRLNDRLTTKLLKMSISRVCPLSSWLPKLVP